MARYVPFLLVLWATAVAGFAQDFADQSLDQWHQWRGPLADGVAPHADPPVQWGADSNIHWTAELAGTGHATPIVWQDRVFVVSAFETERQVEELAPATEEPPGGYKTQRPRNFYRFLVICLDRNSGQLLWQRTACEAVPHEGRHGTNSYASCSPTTDGQRLYVSFGSQGIFCYDLDGNRLWDRDLGDMVTRSGWGEGTSPVVHGDAPVINWDHEGQSCLEVLDAETGQTRWRVERDEVTTWVTPRVVEHQGRTQVIVPATHRISSYDLSNGEMLWQCGGLTTNVIPCPVTYNDTVICMSGYRGTEARSIRLDSRGDITDDPRQVVWQLHRDTPYVPSPLLSGNRLYFTKSNVAILSCFDAGTGQSLAESVRLPEMQSMYASPVAAAGRIYLASREGITVVIKDQPELDVLSINHLPEGINASPAVVGSQLFVRGERHLYCLKESGDAE